MSRLFAMLGIGIVLILVGVAYLLIALQGSDNALMRPLYQLSCESDETIETSRRYNSASMRDSLVFSCVDTEGTRRDVSNQSTLIIFAGFGLFFLSGMGFIGQFASSLMKYVLGQVRNASDT